MFTKEESQFQFSFLSMLLSFLVIMIAAPLAKGIYSSFIVSIFLGFILISSVSALSSNFRTLVAGIILGGCSLTLMGIDLYNTSWWVHLFSQVTAALLIGLTVVVHFKKVFYSKEYDRNTAFGSVCVFLLIGFFFSLVYSIIEHVFPESFKGLYSSTIDSGEMLSLTEMYQIFLYFSFVTQTTLGYGDIVPQTHLAQNIAITQAIMGQFYIAILVAGLLGKILRNKD